MRAGFLICFFLFSKNVFSQSVLSVFLPDTVRVGNGTTYTSLTKAGGLFEAFNNNIVALNRNLTVLITSDLLEDGTNSITNNGLNGYSISFKPSIANVLSISNDGNLAKNLLTIYGAKKVFIDGSYNGSGRYLRFVNTNTDDSACKSAISISGNADSVTITNIIAETNQKTSYNNIFTGLEAGTLCVGAGNNTNIKIQQCEFKNAMTGATGVPDYGIVSIGAGNSLAITGNDIYNFSITGVWLYKIADGAVVNSNHLYYNIASPAGLSQTGIEITKGGKHRIENNFVGGSSRFCGGMAWTNDGHETVESSDCSFRGIVFGDFNTDSNFAINNTVQNINLSAANGVFNGIYGTGLVKIKGNTIGDSDNANSIINAGNKYTSGTVGIGTNGGSVAVDVSENTVANITTTGVSDQPTGAGLTGLSIFGNGLVKVLNNKIHHLNCNSTQGLAASAGTMCGIFLWSSLQGYLCEGNSIWSLKATNTGNNLEVIGINISSSSVSNSLSRNRIFGLENNSLGGGIITGIKNNSCGFDYINNQISLDNGSNTNNITIYGILSGPYNGTCNYYYNSIYIGGHVADTANSYGIAIKGRHVTKKFYNNLIYNERVSGSGNHFALSLIMNTQNINWAGTVSNYNLFATKNSNIVNEWASACCSGQPQSLQQWRTITKGDTSSYSAITQNVPSSLLFSDISIGNLNINANYDYCWSVNGKGMPVSGISSDFDSATGRSATVTAGATDIGADEFNTSTIPSSCTVYGNHQPGGADTLSFNNRIIAVLKWNTTGTLPTLNDAKWYSGVWPNDTTNNSSVYNARFMNSYIAITATGGNNYTYSLALFYDSAMLGKVINSHTMVINKRIANNDGSWISYPASIVNSSLKKITVNSLSSFSEFTATDADATLSPWLLQVCAGSNTTITSPVTGTAYQWQIDTGLGFINIVDNAVFSGSNTITLTAASIPSSWYGYKLRCVVDGSSTAIAIINITNSWTGAIDNTWENPANWSCGSIPDINTAVIIAGGSVTLNSNVFVRSLQISNSANFIINNGYSIIIAH